MAAPALDLHDEIVERALRELRQHRKARRLGGSHFFDALYRAYLAAIAGGLGVTLLSGIVGDRPVAGSALADVGRAGPGVVGCVLASVILLGLRSGGRGGPLALEAADVRYVLLAPIDRDVALRQPALRHLRHTTFLGTVAGAVVGLLAFRRFPGEPLAWIGAGVLVGAAAALAMAGAAMVASGRRWGRHRCTAAGLPLVAWSLADAATGRITAPTSFAGEVALAPLGMRSVGLLSLAAAAVLAVAGVRAVGGISLEAAERRARLVSHLRFAATFQDLRTVMLLRRQLNAEVPRAIPWIRLRPARGGPVTWRRDWRGILRWPASRFLRLAGLGVVCGAAAAGAWAGTTPLIVAAGAALFVAALDAIEGLAQEVDHPDRRDSFPHPDGAIHLRHLAAPITVLLGVGLLAIASAAAASGAPAMALQVGLPLLLPGAAMAAGAAAVSTLRKPPDPSRLVADSTGMMVALYHGLPPALATLAPAALLVVRWQLGRSPGAAPAGLAASAALNVSLLAILVLGWVRHREGLGAYLSGGGFRDVGK